jgi:hypothetical protein
MGRAVAAHIRGCIRRSPEIIPLPIDVLRQQIRAELAQSGLLYEGQIGLGR